MRGMRGHQHIERAPTLLRYMSTNSLPPANGRGTGDQRPEVTFLSFKTATFSVELLCRAILFDPCLDRMLSP